ncbi:hypothetical protein Bhyg_09692 [Pseudolycoriella hygida]|uniref:Uncharacterized protein n=1 Tax=Pseudolycoriella hygida TaxID=35572 RepID=A0A9Q0MS41_9DIPT|nr:hypothetical protein Bhyg_09692 [Pseudolycoriella hygida]
MSIFLSMQKRVNQSELHVDRTAEKTFKSAKTQEEITGTHNTSKTTHKNG